MSHWAELDKNNVVLRVTVGNNSEPDKGYQWLIDNLGGTWIETSYNTHAGLHNEGGTPLRKNYAGVGMTYDQERDAFIFPKLFESWILNEDTCIWEAPVSYPTDDNIYTWNEESLSWVEITD
jgi:hypothetical protein